MVVNGHTVKNALPHIIMLQLAKEWCAILIYRPYYRPVAQMGGSRSSTSSADNLQNLAVRVRMPRYLCVEADTYSDVIDPPHESTPSYERIMRGSDSVTHLRRCSISLSRPVPLTSFLPSDITVQRSKMAQSRVPGSVLTS